MRGTIRSERPARSPRMRVLPAVAVMSAVLVAGCGAGGARNPSSKTSRSRASTGGGSVSTRSTLAFSKCMRAGGVPNFPDLTARGMRIASTQGPDGKTLSVNGVSVNAPAFAAARQRCQPYMAHTQVSPAQAAQTQQRGLEFARCMRSHGVPTFPDPFLSSRGGNQQVRLSGVNPRSPAFRAAAKACGGFGPKGP